MEVKAQIKQWGNSYGIRISKKDAKRLGVMKGETVNIKIQKKEHDIDHYFGICKDATAFTREKEDRF